MDIRLKKFNLNKDKSNNKKSNINHSLEEDMRDKRVIINIIAFCLMAVMAFGIIMFYPNLSKMSQNRTTTPYEDYNIMHDISNMNLVLYKDIVQKTSGEEKSIEDIYIKSYTDNHKYGIEDNKELENEYEDSVLGPLRSRVYNLQSKLDFELKNLEYAALDKNGNVIINRGLNNINDISSYSELQNSYGFYVVINYDKDGYPTIKDYYGTDFKFIKDIFSENMNRYKAEEYDTFSVEYNRITDTTIIYAVPKDLKYDDEIYNLVNGLENTLVDRDTVIAFGLIAGITLLFIGLIIPYKIEKEIAGFKNILNIPFEIGCILYFIGSILLTGFTFMLTEATVGGNAADIMEYLGMSTAYDNTVVYSANLITWFVVIYFILSGMTYLKQIFNLGIKRYIKERFLIVRIYRFILRKTENALDYLSRIDLSDKSNKVIIKVLIANFFIISAVSIIWFFGIFAALVYNVILFFLIRKYYDKVRDNYRELLKATNKIAEGHLDVEIKEDLGLFNPFKDELKKIQSGFKKAVDEEVKSQKMKTELISNVSHDLKTPLTSIITYVDLLKKDDATEEERKSYIDTIDKKSQRLKFLIEDLFEVSKATSGSIQLNLMDVDIIELIRQVEVELSDKFQNAEVIVKNNFPENKIILSLDSQKTFRVFENLFNNAAKYSMAGSRVYVDVNENSASVEITIKNMSAVEIDYNADEIIERFQRGDKSRNTEGSGLGLAIVKSFIEAQGGTFKVELDGDLFKTIIIFNKNK